MTPLTPILVFLVLVAASIAWRLLPEDRRRWSFRGSGMRADDDLSTAMQRAGALEALDAMYDPAKSPYFREDYQRNAELIVNAVTFPELFSKEQLLSSLVIPENATRVVED